MTVWFLYISVRLWRFLGQTNGHPTHKKKILGWEREDENLLSVCIYKDEICVNCHLTPSLLVCGSRTLLLLCLTGVLSYWKWQWRRGGARGSYKAVIDRKMERSIWKLEVVYQAQPLFFFISDKTRVIALIISFIYTITRTMLFYY